MRRPLAALFALGIVVSGAPTAHAAATRWPAEGTGVFRQATYERGEWIYTNGIHQNLGANSDRLERPDYFAPVKPVNDTVYRLFTYDFFGMHRVATNGDFELPTDRTKWPDFTGDLAELRLAANSRDLLLRLRYTSMPRPDAQIATIAFARDGSVGAAHNWPNNAGVKSPWQTAITLWGTGGRVDRASGSVPVASRVRTGDHTVEARIPLRLLPPSPWRVWGGSGLTDPLDSSQYWTVPQTPATPATPGGGSVIGNNYVVIAPNVFTLLFARDAPWTFDERWQSFLLLHGDATPASEVVSLRALQSHATIEPPVRIGRLSRMFSSRLDRGDGIRRFGTGIIGQPDIPRPPVGIRGHDVGELYDYTGRLQSYGMYVPSSYPSSGRAFPLIVYLHGQTGQPDEPFFSVVGFEQQLERRGYLLASPLGRGDLDYTAAGEIDVLEVIEDVRRHYHVDPNRIYLMGHSMGGLGTHIVSMRNPDLFAAVAPVEGIGSEQLQANLRNVAWFDAGAVFDADPNANEQRALYSYLSQRGYAAQLLVYQSKTHEYSVVYDSLPRMFDFFETHPRTADPPIVTYTRVPDAAEAAVGLAHDASYWIRGMMPRSASAVSTVEAESFAIPHRVLDPRRARRTDEMVDEGGSSGGTSAELFRTTPAYGALAPRANRLTLTMTNLRSVRVDAARARLDPAHRITVNVRSDSRCNVVLERVPTGKWSIVVNGSRWTDVSSHGSLVVPAPKGASTITIGPAR